MIFQLGKLAPYPRELAGHPLFAHEHTPVDPPGDAEYRLMDVPEKFDLF